jgi:two-component system, chemotaxis family, protein-glutamate methylesterase/glutaminase
MKHPIVVIGASAGGMAALTKLAGSLPPGFPAPVFVAQHMSADQKGDALVQKIAEAGSLTCSLARNGEAIRGGHIFVAPPDHHLLVGKTSVIVSKGARENRSRPAIDPLFRSAAVAFGGRVIAIVLTGNLDDGTAGLIAVKRCGGVSVVQDPADAQYPDMPQHALNNAPVDYRLPLASMSTRLTEFVHQKKFRSVPVPADILSEAKIAERVISDVNAVNELGHQVPFNCPNCGGVLWRVEKGKVVRFRCHTGHAFTADVLAAEQTKKIEETLWVALRMFEERKNLLTTMAHRMGKNSGSARERLKDSQVHIERIRAILLAGTEMAGEKRRTG